LAPGGSGSTGLEGEAVAWWKAGLGPGEARVARELADNGVRPEHLGLVIRKETIVARLH
jgi:hypothetical protein